MLHSDFYYHWTSRSALDRIVWTGLDPDYAEGKLKVVWFCDYSRVAYALGHIAYRHGWTPDEMVLLRFPCLGVSYAYTAWPGIFTSDRRVRIGRGCAVRLSILDPWVTVTSYRRSRGHTDLESHGLDSTSPPSEPG